MTIHALIGNMESLLQQHGQLLELGEQKKIAIMANDTNLLIELTNQESRLVKQISQTENQRLRSVQAVLGELGMKADPRPKVSDIISYLTNANDKLKLTELSDRLVSTVEQLRMVNDLNLRLTEQALEFNNFSLDVLTGAFDQEFTYGKQAASNGKSQINLFDSKA